MYTVCKGERSTNDCSFRCTQWLSRSSPRHRALDVSGSAAAAQTSSGANSALGL